MRKAVSFLLAFTLVFTMAIPVWAGSGDSTTRIAQVVFTTQNAKPQVKVKPGTAHDGNDYIAFYILEADEVDDGDTIITDSEIETKRTLFPSWLDFAAATTGIYFKNIRGYAEVPKSAGLTDITDHVRAYAGDPTLQSSGTLLDEATLDPNKDYLLYVVSNRSMADGANVYYQRFSTDATGNLAVDYAIQVTDKIAIGGTAGVNYSDLVSDQELDITVTNSGLKNLGLITLTLGGTSPSAFKLASSSIATLTTGSAQQIKVTADKTGIDALDLATNADGSYIDTTYKADVIVSNASIAAVVKVPVSIKVKPGTQSAPTGITKEAVSVAGNDGKIGKVSDAMEFRLTGAAAWTKVTAGATVIENLAAGTYQVRYAKDSVNKKNPSPAAPVTVGGAYSLAPGTIKTTYGAVVSYNLKDQLVTADGTTNKVTFSKTAGEFPTGISMTADGIISGTPTQVTTASVTIQATDGNNSNATVSAVYTIDVKAEKPSAVQNLGATAGDKTLTIEWKEPETLGSDNVWYDIVVTHEAITTTPSTVVTYPTVGGVDKIQFPTADQSQYLANENGVYTLTIGGVSTTFAAVTIEAITVSSSSIATDVAVGTTQTALSRPLSGLDNDTTYYFAVKAVNSEGAGPVTYASAKPVATPTPTPSPSKGGGGGSVSNDWTVTYDVGSHGKITSGSKTETISKTADKPYPSKVPTVTANSGYKFMGWSLDGKKVLDPKDQKISANTKFVAVYQRQGGTHATYMNGYPDGTFRPDGQVTRAEVTTMMSQLIGGYDANGNYDSSLADVWNDWYTNYINYCVSKGLITGYEDGSFRPNADITRAEFATIVAKYLNLPNDGTSASADANTHWAEGYISQLQAKGIISGYEDGTIRPDAKITRAEAVTMLNRAFSRQPLTSAVKDSKDNYTVSLSDVNTDHWAYYEILEAAVEHIDADFHKTEQ